LRAHRTSPCPPLLTLAPPSLPGAAGDARGQAALCRGVAVRRRVQRALPRPLRLPAALLPERRAPAEGRVLFACVRKAPRPTPYRESAPPPLPTMPPLPAPSPRCAQACCACAARTAAS
jgi:hypothetical protein